MRTVPPEKWVRNKKLPSSKLPPRRHLHSFEMNVRNSLCDAMQDFWKQCSLRGLNRLSREDMPKMVRWICVTAGTLGLISASFLLLAHVFEQLPPQGTLFTSLHSIQRVPFPAVALCSTNVIATKPLDDYTALLYSRMHNNSYRKDVIRSKLLKFGGLVTMGSQSSDVMFMEFLAKVDPYFSVSHLMYKLSPLCTDLLRQCSWRGRVVPCDRLFATRNTPLGYCCVFNSRYYAEDAYNTPKYLDLVDKDFGLYVVVQENPDNFAFVRRPYFGLEVILFDGTSYPLMGIGGVRIYPVEQNCSARMTLWAHAQYSPEKCGLGQTGAYGACMTQCRRRTLAGLCACRLHTLPPNPTDNHPVCSLAHLDCLTKHKEKLINFYPFGFLDPTLDDEMLNGQDCEECTPDCARLSYSASVAIARYSHHYKDKIFKSIFTRNRTLINSTTIRLFYASEHQHVFIIDDKDRYLRTALKLGGAWWTLTGASLVSLIELVYHCTLRWAHHYRRRTTLGRAMTGATALR